MIQNSRDMKGYTVKSLLFPLGSQPPSSSPYRPIWLCMFLQMYFVHLEANIEHKYVLSNFCRAVMLFVNRR